MRRYLPLLLLSLLVGCAENDSASLLQARGGGGDYDENGLRPLASGDDDDDDLASGDDDDDATDDEDPSDPNYALDIVSIHPAPNSMDHHYRQPLVVGFNGYAAGVEVAIVNEDGDTLGTLDSWNDDFTELTIQPFELHDGSSFLRPTHSYEVGVDIGTTSLSWSFGTSEVGTAIPDPSVLQGATFAIDFTGARSTETPLLAKLLAGVSGPTWLWQVDVDADGDGVDFNSGVGNEDEADADALEQDLCVATGLVGGADAAVDLVYNPYFASPPGEFLLWLDGVQIAFEGGWIDGDFVADGTEMVEVGFRGYLREDSMEPLLGPSACSMLTGHAGLVCEPCPSGDGECAWVEVEGVGGAQTSLELAEVDADGDCDDSAAPPTTVLNCSTGGGAGGLWLLLPLMGLIRRR